MENKVKFNRNVVKNGTSITVNWPKELLNYINLEAGNEVEMIGDEGKHGRFIAIWKKED